MSKRFPVRRAREKNWRDPIRKARFRLGILRDRLRGWTKRHPLLLRRTAYLLIGLMALGGGVAAGSWQAVCRDCPSIAQIYVWEPIRATRIFSHDDKLITELYTERRTPVDIASLPEYVPQAFVAIEDKRFYGHSGYSIHGILRAVVVRTPILGGLLGRRAGGGSTITQQLARHMFTEDIGFEQRATRKLKELKVALELEKVYNKDQILAAYINQINYGHGWYGIETAAQNYFGKPAVELNPAEAALLAAVINRPGTYDPFKNPENARGRRNHVLTLMAQQGFLSEADAEKWKQEPIPESRKGGDEARLAPYFVEWVRTQMDDRYGSRLYNGGLRIYTTLDVEMQRSAQAALDSGFAYIESRPNYRHLKYKDRDTDKVHAESPYLQGMFIAMDPYTGAVRAMIGGRDFKESKFNRATQAFRQPGSVFKPFVMTAAIAGGIPITHLEVDEPFSMTMPDGQVWEPANYDPGFRGPLTMRETLRNSVNIPTIKLALQVGLDAVVQYARRLGIKTPIPEYPSIALGAADVIPMQMVEAYSVFATGGYHPSAYAVRRVEDAEGRVLWEPKPQLEQVLDSTTTALVRDLMQTVINNGSGYPARDPAQGGLPYEIPAAGKTGTTNDYTNVWFVGYTPNLVAAVWYGFDRPKPIIGRAAGGLFAAPVWGRFMRSVYYGENAKLPKPDPWALPANVVVRSVDRSSGKLAGPFCPTDQVIEEIFAEGTEPTDACDLHGPALLGQPLRRDTTIPPH